MYIFDEEEEWSERGFEDCYRVSLEDLCEKVYQEVVFFLLYEVRLGCFSVNQNTVFVFKMELEEDSMDKEVEDLVFYINIGEKRRVQIGRYLVSDQKEFIRALLTEFVYLFIGSG